MCDGAHGAVLIPWPNRLGDGSYEFDGARHQLALSEPERRNAIHGLVRWVPWRALERDGRARPCRARGCTPTPAIRSTSR